MNVTWRIIIRGFIPLILASITIADVDRPAKNHVARTILYTSILAQFENCTYDSPEVSSKVGGQYTTVALSHGTVHNPEHQYSFAKGGITAKAAQSVRRKDEDMSRRRQQIRLHQQVTPRHHENVRNDVDTSIYKVHSNRHHTMDIALIHFESVRKRPVMTDVTPIGEFTLTAYSLSRVSTGKVPGMPGYGITYSGTKAKAMRTVAVDPRVIPIGTPIFIEGIGWRLAEDTGGAVKGRHIDVLLNSHEEAIQFGVRRHIRVYIERAYAESVMTRLSKE